MNKRTIIIVSTGLRIGGVERSLIGLLESFDYEKNQVTLFLFGHDGDLMKNIPPEVTLLNENQWYAAIEKPIRTVVLSRRFPIAIARILAEVTRRFRSRFLNIRGFALPRYVRNCLPFLPAIPGCYDLALSFLTPHDTVIKKVSAKRKVGWVHTDYSAMESGVDHAFELPIWRSLDSIVAVSDSVKATFSTVFPEVSDKLSVIENIVSAEFVREQAKESIMTTYMHEEGVIKICSVGRFCYAKNFECIPDIVLKLNEVGIRVGWWIIGFGNRESLIKEKIAEADVGDQVHVVGKASNPYPYMNACDLYVQPSRYEGKAVAVREAQILGRTVIITDFPTAKSQLEDGVDGIICPLNIDGVAEAIRKLVEDPALRKDIASTARSRDYSNSGEVKKVYQMYRQVI